MSVVGTTISCADDEAAIPAGTTGITVTRLIVEDPGTGSARLGIEGHRVSVESIEFSVWDANDYPADRLLAIVDGANTFPYASPTNRSR